VVTDTGDGINIYRRGDDGVWRVARDGWSSDQPRAAESWARRARSSTIQDVMDHSEAGTGRRTPMRGRR
jgi:hypothetical protein